MTKEVASNLGYSHGKVIMPNNDLELHMGGDFMHVKVAVNITKSLCRGRKATFRQNSNGWISFKYKQLPNCCFWCGRLDHGDKECDMWLKIKGLLSSKDQQFGTWLCASQFNLNRKTVMKVKGFDSRFSTSRHDIDPQSSLGSKKSNAGFSKPLVIALAGMKDDLIISPAMVSKVVDEKSVRISALKSYCMPCMTLCSM